MMEQETYKKKLELFQAMAQVEAKEKALKSSQGYFKAYLLSILIPPIGIYYFVRYIFFGDGEEGTIKAGIVSLILTLVSLFLSIWLTVVFFKQATGEIIDNQKKLKELYQ